MGYSKDILSHKASDYTLSNATITNGTLYLSPGGSAKYNITTKKLTALTDSFKFICKALPPSDRYIPNVLVHLKAMLSDDKHVYDLYMSPVKTTGSLYECIFSFDAGAYDYFYIELTSSVTVAISVWELRPEAIDENAQTIIGGIEQSLPRLLYDYNTEPFDVGINETTVGTITCRLLDATDIQGHFLITFTATVSCTVVVRFYDMDIEELFAPLYYDIIAGRNTIGVPHSYLHRSAGLHSFIVTMQAYGGALYVDTRGVLFTIDGGYLAARELDIALDVYDIAIRQPAGEPSPDEVWVAGINEDGLVVSKRDYSETNANVAFDTVTVIKNAIACAIEFNGVWSLAQSRDHYTIYTDEEPVIFRVAKNKTLYVHHGINARAITLDTDVVFVRACRGYNSVDYPDQDQGLVVAYVKSNGSVYYSQYLYNSAAASYQWLTPMLLIQGTWEYVTISRLNDYRLSFVVSNSTSNVWLYTERTWVGQATPPQYIELSREADHYEVWYGSKSTDAYEVHVTHFDVEDSVENGYYIKLFHLYLDTPILLRHYAALADFASISGTFAEYFESIEYNAQLNSIDITYRLPSQHLGDYSNTLQLSNTAARIVGKFDAGYYPVASLSYTFDYIAPAIELDTATTVTLGVDFSSTLTYDVTVPGRHIHHESFTLESISSTLSYNVIDHLTNNSDTAIQLVGISSTLTYDSTYVDPV